MFYLFRLHALGNYFGRIYRFSFSYLIDIHRSLLQTTSLPKFVIINNSVAKTTNILLFILIVS
jgi:hypothetical protein